MKQVKEDVAVLKWDVASLKEGQSRQDKILGAAFGSFNRTADMVEVRRMR